MADGAYEPPSAETCGEMEVWNPFHGMCDPVAMAGMNMSMAMLHGNVFAGYVGEQGPRGRPAAFSSNMIMGDIGTSIGTQYLNVDLMATSERWTFPDAGYPELLQIGETNANGVPYIDAQHPHSSPIMGLTLSDTLRLGAGEKNLTVFFAPRGESTDGPIAFMHRPTGQANPDAPLGHHVGQDVGHISSTVIGASLAWETTRLEVSMFHGAEPSPQAVDLPIGTPDSVGVRVSQSWTPHLLTMASFAYVANPEPDEPDITAEYRYSASAYHTLDLGDDWRWENALIFGGIHHLDRASFLASFAEEFCLRKHRSNAWGRIEILQRTPAELAIATGGDPNGGLWVTAVTLGYTFVFARFEAAELGVGASITKDLLPAAFSPAYGGNPWSGRVFLQAQGMKMWSLGGGGM